MLVYINQTKRQSVGLIISGNNDGEVRLCHKGFWILPYYNTIKKPPSVSCETREGRRPDVLCAYLAPKSFSSTSSCCPSRRYFLVPWMPFPRRSFRARANIFRDRVCFVVLCDIKPSKKELNQSMFRY